MAENANDVKATAEADAATTEASTEETNTSTDNSTDDEFVLGFTNEADGEPEEKESKKEDPAPKEEKSESTEPEEKSTRADARKQQLNSEIRDKIAERNALRDEIAELSKQKYNLKSAQDIPTVESLVEQINPNTGDYYTRAEAENLRINQRLDAMEEQRAFNDYVERVADSRIQLSNEANQVVKDFPIFDPDSDQYNAELTAMADEIMQGSLIIDENTGQVIESTEPEEKSTRADARKQQLNSEIRDKIAERNALRDEIAELSKQKYNLKSAQDIPTVESLVEQINPNTGDYYTRAEAENLRINQRLDAMEEQRAFNDYVERVADSRIQLSNEANQVVKDFPIFDPDSDQYNAELTAMADEIMQGSLIIDENTGQVIGSKVSPYKVYSAIAKAKASGEVGGKTSGRKAALDMMNNADVGSSVAAPSSKEDKDDFLAGFLGN